MSTASDAVERVRQALLSPYRSGVDDGGMLTRIYDALAAVGAAGDAADLLAPRVTALEALTYLDAYNALSSGQSVFPRLMSSASAGFGSSGSLRLSYFSGRTTFTAASLRMVSAGTAAGATPTLVRMGLYTEAANGDLTLVGSTPNDTALFAAQNTSYTKAMSAPVSIVKGTRYALGVVIVTGAALPALSGLSSSSMATEWFVAPKVNGLLTGQTDLPASIANGLISGTSALLYGSLIP